MNGCADSIVHIIRWTRSTRSHPHGIHPGEGGNEGSTTLPTSAMMYSTLRGTRRRVPDATTTAGELIFESTDVRGGWDGNYRGQPSPQDAYVYQLWVRFVDGREVERTETSPCCDESPPGPIALFAGLLSTPAAAWDPQLSQFYASPMYLNPALTGNTYLWDRLQLNYRLQWAGIPPGFETYAVGWDHRAAQVNSGVGVMVMHDRAGSNGPSFTQALRRIPTKLWTDRKRAMRGGLRLGYTQRSYDPDNFLFADQVIRDNASTSLESGSIERVPTSTFQQEACTSRKPSGPGSA